MPHSPSARTPLWRHIAQTLANDIVSGLYPIGSHLPTEMELMAQYDVSRHTVREALDELVTLGLIVRKPRQGTRVVSTGHETIWELKDNPFFLPNQARRLIEISRHICDESISKQTGFAVRTPLLTLAYVTLETDGTLISFTQSWIRDTARDIVPVLTQNTDLSVIELLERHADIRCSRIEQTFHTVLANSTVAQHLNISVATPIMLSCETFYDRRSIPLVVAHRFFNPQANNIKMTYAQQRAN